MLNPVTAADNFGESAIACTHLLTNGMRSPASIYLRKSVGDILLQFSAVAAAMGCRGCVSHC